MHNTYLFLAYLLGIVPLILLFILAWKYHKKFFVAVLCVLAVNSWAVFDSSDKKSCPNYSVERCKLSFKDLVEVVSKCPFVDAKNCYIIFMESLHALDKKAPFYSSLFDGFMMKGNLEFYKAVYRKLSDDDKDILRSLSAALAIEVRNHFRNMGLIDTDGEDEVKDAVTLRYRIDMKRPFEKARPRHEKQFIDQARKYAQFISWPHEVKNIQYGIRNKVRELRQKKNADPNDPTPEFGKEDYAFAAQNESSEVR